MNKKGFTIVELLAVIVVLAVVAVLAFPAMIGVIRNNQKDNYNEVVNNIILAAKSMNANHSGSLKQVPVSTLKEYGYLTGNQTNPIDNSILNGCVYVDNGKYSYKEENCDFVYDVNVNSYLSIGTMIKKNFPELELGTSGCKTANASKNYSYMNGCYLKGAQTKNYLWYSGFLWRIMGINSDGTVRLITEENVTAIPYNASSSNFEGSHVDSWLNEYFYNNLRGTNIIVSNNFCQGAATATSPSRIDCTGGNTLNKKVGLMSIDEYNLAGGTNSYLKNSQNFWTMSPMSSTGIWNMNSDGSTSNGGILVPYGLRAVINVNSNSTITGGNGILSSTWTNETSPYILNENKSTSITGLLKDKVTPGEYLKLANKIYRVVSVDSSGNTKLILDGYYQETSGTSYKMAYGSNNTFTPTSGIGQKLNTSVLDWLIPASDTASKNKLVSSYIWYQNTFDLGNSYTVSLNETTPTRSIGATVGLIRVGEMLSSQSHTILTKNGSTTSSYINAQHFWTMTPYTGTYGVWFDYVAGGSGSSASTSEYGLRPVIVVNSAVTITSGNGTPSNPYEI